MSVKVFIIVWRQIEHCSRLELVKKKVSVNFKALDDRKVTYLSQYSDR